jgi:hypothetical protein
MRSALRRLSSFDAVPEQLEVVLLLLRERDAVSHHSQRQTTATELRTDLGCARHRELDVTANDRPCGPQVDGADRAKRYTLGALADGHARQRAGVLDVERVAVEAHETGAALTDRPPPDHLGCRPRRRLLGSLERPTLGTSERSARIADGTRAAATDTDSDRRHGSMCHP